MKRKPKFDERAMQFRMQLEAKTLRRNTRNMLQYTPRHTELFMNNGVFYPLQVLMDAAMSIINNK